MPEDVDKPLNVLDMFKNLNKIGKHRVRNALFGRMNKLSLEALVWDGSVQNHHDENHFEITCELENREGTNNDDEIILDANPTPPFVAQKQEIVNHEMMDEDIEPIIEVAEEFEEDTNVISILSDPQQQMENDETLTNPIDPSILATCSHEYPKESSNFKGFKASEFQNAILDHCDKVREHTGHKTGLVVLATGLGKTILVILDIERELSRIKQNDLKKFKMLFLVHSKVIRDTSFSKFKMQFTSEYQDLDSRWDFKDSDFLNITENENQASIEGKLKRAKFVFCLFQSFEKINLKDSQFTHCVIDEVHHVVATTYNKAFKSLMKLPSLKYMLGMTATLVHREDPTGDKLKEKFKGIVYVNLPWRLAKTLGFFPPVEYLEYLPYTIQSSLDILTYQQIFKEAFDPYNNPKRQLPNFIAKLDKSLHQLGMNTDEQVKKKLTPENITNVLIQFFTQQINAGLQTKRKTIIFANSCETADKISKIINEKSTRTLQLKASSIHYKKGIKQTKQILEDFSNGKLNVLVNVMMVSEGYDVKDVDCLVLARQTESEIVFLQQIGRAMRRNTDKSVTIIDLALNLRKRWKRLFNDDFQNEEELKKMVVEFWNVENFVGDPINFQTTEQ
ncbi:hypothetical protein C9374_003281 [Naegleria lovaniensis]|uniref:Uncharacterized protein n=1 Tax=Naegleria lovaniensis TaxID=51637 RepID=A0AA88KLL1_NAELO|nr:uncharacterized protein C9374_003281 [Naegleria lovaniensis]KAG2385466.1 hypothetical protein C9374_003281 [Naegleria lovaniensis]